MLNKFSIHKILKVPITFKYQNFILPEFRTKVNDISAIKDKPCLSLLYYDIIETHGQPDKLISQ
jgi:hypothetical protein